MVHGISGMPDLTNAQKLIELKGYLLGEALNLVENLPVVDDCYDLAIQLLDTNFLDKDLTVDKVLTSILQAPEVVQLKDVEAFIRSISNKIQDLQGLGVNLSAASTDALLLTSKIINMKLPRQFLIELSRKTNSNYPTYNQLLSNSKKFWYISE